MADPAQRSQTAASSSLCTPRKRTPPRSYPISVCCWETRSWAEDSWLFPSRVPSLCHSAHPNRKEARKERKGKLPLVLRVKLGRLLRIPGLFGNHTFQPVFPPFPSLYFPSKSSVSCTIFHGKNVETDLLILLHTLEKKRKGVSHFIYFSLILCIMWNLSF